MDEHGLSVCNFTQTVFHLIFIVYIGSCNRRHADNGIHLNQVLINLLGNAVKFTPEEGMIQVSLYEEDSPRGGEYVRVHILVKDNGIGMSEATS